MLIQIAATNAKGRERTASGGDRTSFVTANAKHFLINNHRANQGSAHRHIYYFSEVTLKEGKPDIPSTDEGK